MRRVAVTGGTGFVGANVARRLINDGHDVHLLVRPGFSSWRIATILPDVELHEVRFDDPEAVDTAVSAIRPEWLFHLAASGAYSWQNDLDHMLHTNVLGTANLVEACLRAGTESFVNAGSSSEYGLVDRPATEDDPPEPNSHYAVTKASATLFCQYSGRRSGMNIPTLRLYSIYGPFEEPRRLMPTLVVHGLHGRLPPLVHPDTARDFVHVDDAVDAFLRAAGRSGGDPGAVYNVASGVQTTIRDVVELVRTELDLDVEPEWASMEQRSWDTDVWVGDPRKSQRELGWRPLVGLKEGLASFTAWFRTDPDLAAFYDE